MLVQPPITIPSGVDTSEVSIASNGTVSVGKQTLGKLSLVDVPAPDGLVADGDSVFSATAASGAIRAAKGASVQQGALEGSNVDMGAEMSKMMAAQQQYAMGSNAIQLRGADDFDRQPDQAMSFGAIGDTTLPPVGAANEPADIRNGNSAAQKAYQEALGFEDILVQQLTQELASTVEQPDRRLRASGARAARTAPATPRAEASSARTRARAPSPA